MGRLPRLPLSIFDRSGVAGRHSLARDQLTYCDLASERQRRANDIVREMHVLMVSQVERQHSALSDAFCQVPNFGVGNWVWLYTTASTIRQGGKAARIKRCSRLNSRSIGRAPTKSLRSAPAPLATHRTVPPCEMNSSFWTSPQTYPPQMRTAVSPSSAASPAPTTTTAATRLSVFRMG